MFSVIVPLYNKAPFIRGTLASALAQERAAFEIIVVDDQSTDGGAEAISDLLGHNVRLVRQPNAGPGAARNRGAEEARYDWLAFLDGDDLWLPSHLATLAQVIETFPDADVVANGFRRASRAQSAQLVEPEAGVPRRVDYFREAGRAEIVWTSAAAVRRAAFAKAGGFGNFWPGEDIEFWARMALGSTIAVSPRATAIYTTGTSGLMEGGGTSAGFSAAPGAEPIFALVDRALLDAAYRHLHADLRLFRNQLLLMRVKPALYGGAADLARDYLRAVDRTVVRPPMAYRLMALLPPPLLRAAARTYSIVKRSFRAR